MVYDDAPWAGPVWIPEPQLAGFIKRTTIHCYTQNMKALDLVVSEKIFYVFLIVSLWEIMTPGAGPFLTRRAWLAGFIKRTTTHCYIQNMKALDNVISEKSFVCSSHDAPGAGPVWTPGARFAGFIKRIIIYCYPQNMKALGHVVLEKKNLNFLCFSHCKSMGAICCHGNQSFNPT